jgi:hypothetical protein
MGLLFEPGHESPCPWQGHVEIIDTKEQEEAVARPGEIGAHQGGMLVGTPLVKAEQDRAIRVEDLPEVVMGRSRLRLAKQRLVPFEAARHIANSNDRPGASHAGPPAA